MSLSKSFPSFLRSTLVIIFCAVSTLGFAQVPTITSFTPTSGPTGTTVTITGTNFSTTASSNVVFFGGIKAAISAATATSLTVTVPTGASNDLITVMAGGLIAYSRTTFMPTYTGTSSVITTSTFVPKQDITVGLGPELVNLADMDLDGKADIVFPSYDLLELKILRNISTIGTLDFASSVSSAVTNSPWIVATGDLDNDGKLDAVVSGFSGTQVSVFVNTSTPSSVSVSKVTDLTAQNAPQGLVIADLDKDGKADLIVVNQNSFNLSFFRNTTTTSGSITFAAVQVIALGSVNPRAVKAADFDGDGLHDIVTANYQGYLSVYRNTTTGPGSTITFATKQDLTIGNTTDAREVVIGDFNQDGKPDLVCSNYLAATISVFINASTGSGSTAFATKVDLTTGANPFYLALGDFEGDGKLDIAVTNYSSNTISIFRNTTISTPATFAAKVDYVTGTKPVGIAAGDLDGDGRPEIVVSNESNSSISIFKNNATASLPTVTSFTPTSAQVGSSVTITGTNFSTTAANNTVKFNGTLATIVGTPTATSMVATVPSGATTGAIAVTVGGVTGVSSTSFTVLPSPPKITSFTPASGAAGSTVTITGTNFSTTAADNVVYFGGIKATVTNGTATSLSVTVPLGVNYSQIRVVTNGFEGVSEKFFVPTFLSSSSTLTSTSFVAATSPTSTSTAAYSVASGDFDLDGDLDLALASYSNSAIYFFENTSSSGTVTYTQSNSITTGTNPYSVIADDFDGDGKLDLVVANYNSSSISVFRNTSTTAGTFTFTSQSSITTGTLPAGLTSADFDGDGRMDLAVNRLTGSTLELYRNSGTATGTISFTAGSTVALPGASTYAVVAGDFDGDGKVDLATADYSSSSASVFRNITTSTTFSFEPRYPLTVGISSYGIVAADFNLDGKLDLGVTSYSSATVYIFPNTRTSTTGGISFGGAVNISTATPWAILAEDLNGDGLPDLAITNYGSSTVSIYTNASTAGGSSISFNASAVTGAVGSTPRFILSGDFDKDGKVDLLTTRASSSTVPISILHNEVPSPLIPSITSFDPTSGSEGTAVTIIGTNFSTTAASNSIKFNGVAATVTGTPTATSISTTVPTGATTGKITITVNGQTGTSANDFTIAPASSFPTVTSFSPSSGLVGTTVVLTGTNFSTTAANNTVKFNGVTANVSGTPTSTSITTVVPSGATTGPISVTVGGLTKSSTSSFTVTIPKITSFSPESGIAGSTVTITGASFSPVVANNTVYFGGVRATVSAATSTSLTVVVPTGANYSQIRVIAGASESVSEKFFIPTFFSASSVLTSTSFASATSPTSTSTASYSVASGDFDLDGDLDLALASYTSGVIYIFENSSTSGTITYTQSSSISVGLNPYSVIADDFDGDGKLDLIAANYTSGSLSVFRNNTTTAGTLLFVSETSITTGSNPSCLASGDFDADGKMDLAVSRIASGAVVELYRNSGTGTGSISFTAGSTIPVPSTTTYSLVTGDFDGDGKVDIATADYSNTSASVFRNITTSSTFSFDTRYPLVAGTTPTAIVAGDFNTDGKLDLAVSNYSTGSVSIFPNSRTSTTGGISFGSPISISSPAPWAILAEDVNGDGKPDLVVANYSSSALSIFSNEGTSGGTISFNASSISKSVGSSPRYLISGDFDGDGKVDIASTRAASSTTPISILHNEVTSPPAPTVTQVSPSSGPVGTFVSITGTNFSTTASNNIVKFNGVVASTTGTPTDTTITAVVPPTAKTGAVTVTTLGQISTGSTSFTVTTPLVSDFTPSTGKVGSSVTISGTNFSTTPANNVVYFGAVKATVSAATATSLTVTVPTGANYAPIRVIVGGVEATSQKSFNVTFPTTSSTITTSSFTSVTAPSSTSTDSRSVAAGDFDGDGKVDLAVVGYATNNILIYLNTSTSGTVTYASGTSLTAGTSPWMIVADDFDGDGKLDLAVTNSAASSVSIFRNTTTTAGTITFTKNTTDLTTGADPVGIASGDFDGDGRVDLVVSRNTGSTVQLFRNTGTATGTIAFTVSATAISTPSTNTFSVIAGDFDGDGLVDIATIGGSTSGTASVFRNTTTTSTLSFATQYPLTVGSDPFGIVSGDFNSDSKLDIAITSYTSGTLSVFTNSGSSGTIGFGSPLAITTSSKPHGIVAEDFNGDGKLDVAITNEGSALVSLYSNSTTGSSTSFGSTPVTFAVGSSPRSIISGDFDGDTKVDFVTANASTAPISIWRNALTIPAPPTITSFTPAFAPVGGSVTITGTNFSTTASSNTVKIGTLNATVTGTPTATSLTAMVPPRAVSGKISVTVNSQTATSATNFDVTTPLISGFSPTSGIAGSSVVIEGTRFDTIVSNNIVYFGAVKATITSGSTKSLTVTVPEGVSYAPIRVITSGLELVSSKLFLPIFFTTSATITTSSFAASTSPSTTSTGSYSVASGDFDGDGKVDLAYASYNLNQIVIHKNTSTSTSAISFGTGSPSTAGTNPYSIIADDFDGDGKLDLAVTNRGSSSVSIFRNTSNSTAISFVKNTTDLTTGTFPIAIGSGDFDGDGRIDLVISRDNTGTTSSTTSTIEFYRNTGTAIGTINFTAGATLIAQSNIVYNLAVGDFDGDGLADLATADYSNTSASVFRNTTTSSAFGFATAVSLTALSGPYGIVSGDFDGNGKLDLAVTSTTSSRLSIYTNTGTSVGTISFGSAINITTNTGPKGIISDDFNGDGKPDLLVANTGTAVSLFQNSSSSSISFGTPVNETTGSTPIAVVSGDFDGNGKVDFASANFSTSSVSVLRNAFSTPPTPTVASFTPIIGGVGTSVTITGSNFSTTAANNTVKFNGTTATISGTPTATAITVSVPAGASTGKVSVTVLGQTGTSLIDFTVVPPPTITDFSPKLGGVGTVVVITGTNFNPTFTANEVKFGTLSGTVTAGTATSLTVTAPTGVATGKLSVTSYDQTVVSTDDFTLAPPPTISDFNPKIGPYGTPVTITGTNFSATNSENIVKFGSSTASVTGSTATSITTSVPTGSATGAISVTVYGQTVSSSVNFTVIFPPTISSFDPSIGKEGTTVTIVGTNFSSVAANNTVKFGSINAAVTASSSTTLQVTVPSGSSTGKISITVNNLSVTSTETFTVDTTIPTVSVSTPTNLTVPTNVTITITASDDVEVFYVEFYKKKALQSVFEGPFPTLTSGSGKSVQVNATISASDFDERGVSFYAIAYDLVLNASNPSSVKTITRDIPDTETQVIPDITIGKGVESYQIIALPYQSASVTQVLDLEKDDKKWRVATYTGSTTSDPYNYQVNSFNPGVGYWLIINDPTKQSLTFNSVNPVVVDEYYPINLKAGWNQIGNPFLQTLNWAQVILYNRTEGVITVTEAAGQLSKIYTYDRGFPPTTPFSSTLQVYQGAFVYAPKAISGFRLPLSALSSSRISEAESTNKTDLMRAGGWEVMMDIKAQDGLRYGVSGFGQIEGAESGFDNYDLFTPILFKKYIKAEFIESNLLEHSIARSIHNSNTNDVWVMNLNSSYKEGTPLEFNFLGELGADADNKVVMLDLNTGQVVDVIPGSSFVYNYKPGASFKIIKGTADFINAEILASRFIVEEIYPNPSQGNFKIPVYIPNVGVVGEFVTVEFLDLSGRKISAFSTDVYPGLNDLSFNLKANDLKSGLYIVEITYLGKKITKKVYLKRNE